MPMLDWKSYLSQIKSGIAVFGKLSPGTVHGYVGLSSAGRKASHLGGKTRELIALAVAVTARCDGCIATHADAALKQGATREDIAEVLGVAVSVNAGAALVYSLRTLDAVGQESA